LIFPGQIWPDSFGPLGLQQLTALTWGQWFNQLRRLRRAIVDFTARVRDILAPWQIAELESPTIGLFTLVQDQLIEKRVDRYLFFRIIHPTFNPLVTKSEASFLRGACYTLRKMGQEFIADAVDRILRSPQLDEFVCHELMASGSLEIDEREEVGFRFLEEYEDMAVAEVEDDSDYDESDTYSSSSEE
jgi:hypothetical protein